MMRDGKENQLQAVGDPDFVENISEVVFNGLFADPELLGDVPISVASDQTGDDL